jgi:hypothetical protein
MIQPIPHPLSGLSYIPAPRYAAEMLDSRLSRPPEPGFPEGYTGQLLTAVKMEFFCRLQPKVTENKNLHDCKDDRTHI